MEDKQEEIASIGLIVLCILGVFSVVYEVVMQL
jgi:hypothetical protein